MNILDFGRFLAGAAHEKSSNCVSPIFIDRQLYNVPQLLAHIKPDSRVVLLEGDRDGIEQIS
jgi:hypothetical protein